MRVDIDVVVANDGVVADVVDNDVAFTVRNQTSHMLIIYEFGFVEFD